MILGMHNDDVLDPEPKHAWREIAVILNDEKMPFTVLVREGSVQMLVLQWIVVCIWTRTFAKAQDTTALELLKIRKGHGCSCLIKAHINFSK